MSRSRASVVSARVFRATLLLILAIACSRSPPEPPAGARASEPVGQDEYERRLSEEAGIPFGVKSLVALALSLEAPVAARMNHLAAEIESDSDWQQVFEAQRQDHPADSVAVVSAYRHEVETAARFLDDRDLVTLPPNLPEVVESRNRLAKENFPLALYIGGKLMVTTSPSAGPDPSYLLNHCHVCIPPLAVHEAYPGHHVAFYHSAVERAGASLGDLVQIHGRGTNRFFHEGWGLYAELLMLQQGYYQDPELELGAWRLFLLRLLRARIDALLHTRKLESRQAISLYQNRWLMESEAAETEVRRHLAAPTEKATYLVGLVQILDLRRKAFAADPELTLRAFHDRLLRRPAQIPIVAKEEFGIELGAPESLDVAAVVGP